MSTSVATFIVAILTFLIVLIFYRLLLSGTSAGPGEAQPGADNAPPGRQTDPGRAGHEPALKSPPTAA